MPVHTIVPVSAVRPLHRTCFGCQAVTLRRFQLSGYRITQIAAASRRTVIPPH